MRYATLTLHYMRASKAGCTACYLTYVALLVAVLLVSLRLLRLTLLRHAGTPVAVSNVPRHMTTAKHSYVA